MGRAPPPPGAIYWGEGAPLRTQGEEEGSGEYLGSLRGRGAAGLLVYSKQCVDSSFYRFAKYLLKETTQSGAVSCRGHVWLLRTGCISILMFLTPLVPKGPHPQP